MKRDVPHFRIGLLLTETGILAPNQLEEAIIEGERSGVPFLRILVSNGTLKQHELQAVIRTQSLIWGGLIDVERAIHALSVVHKESVSIDEGLRHIGWVRPVGILSDTLSTSVRIEAVELPAAGVGSEGVRSCQYCGTTLNGSETLCSFCTGENALPRLGAKLHIEPAWQRHAQPADGRIVAPSMARDPVLMAFLSGCCLAGLGQLLLGQTVKGACFIVFYVVVAFATGGVASLIFGPIAAVDAYLLADKLRNGKSIGSWEFF